MPNGQQMKFHLTKKSTNSKTGPLPVSTSPESTCPTRCPLKGTGCYADSGPLALHWKKVSNKERGSTWNGFLKQIANLPKGQLWRHNQAGDLRPDKEDKSRIDRARLAQLVMSNKDKKGFTYTHYEVLEKGYNGDWNRGAIREANQKGFTINLSADSLEEADRLAQLEIGPVTTTLPSNTTKKITKTPGGLTVITCPAAIGDDTTCSTCSICAKANRKSIIGFPAHGTRKKRVDRMLAILQEE